MDFRHVNQFMHSVIKMPTKISLSLANVNIWNNFMVSHQVTKVFHRWNRWYFYSIWAFVDLDCHICLGTPSSELIKQGFNFSLKASYSSSIIYELKKVSCISTWWTRLDVSIPVFPEINFLSLWSPPRKCW